MAALTRLTVFIVGTCIFTAGAFATPRDYCDAYARDFADRGPKETSIWKERQNNALRDCLFTFAAPTNTNVASPAPTEKKPAPPVNTASRKTKNKAAVQQAEQQEPAPEELPEPAVIVLPDTPPPQNEVNVVSPQDTVAPKKKKTLFNTLFKKQADPPAAAVAEVSLKKRLIPGSSDWLDYCERKYASFNRSTGTYKSFKGVERKCLVTN